MQNTKNYTQVCHECVVQNQAGAVAQFVWLLFSLMPISHMFFPYGVSALDDMQDNKKPDRKIKKGDNVHQKELTPFDARCPSFLKPAKARGMFPLSPLFYDVS